MRGDNQQQNRFFELLEPELPRFQAFCRKLTGDADWGDDLVQDALYDAWRGFERLRQDLAFKSWLYQIAVNRYRTDLRKWKKQAGPTLPLTNDLVNDGQSRLRLARDRLNVAMAGLSAADRALVTLHELEGWSYSDLAAMFGSREGRLRTRLTRCRRRMQETLQRHMERAEKDSFAIGANRSCVVVKQKDS